MWGYNLDKDLEQFRVEARKTIDYIAEKHLNMHNNPIHKDHDKGFLDKVIPENPPTEPRDFGSVLKDIDQKIIKNYTQYSHPGFMADSNHTSYPAIIGSFISDAFNNPGVSWIANPAGFELERIILDYLAEEFKLPENFRREDSGCCVHLECGESANVSVLAARFKKRLEFPDQASKFTYYFSKESNPSIKKAVYIGGGICREINSIRTKDGSNFEIDFEQLKSMISQDTKEGLIPTFVCASLGNYSTIAVDNIPEISKFTKENKIWCHIDASILGNTLLLEDYRHYLSGLESANSIVIEGQKALPVGLDSAFYWVDEAKYVFKALNEDFVLYVQFFKDNQAEMTNYHFGTARATKSLRLWMVLKSYGMDGLRNLVRKQIDFSKKLEEKIIKNSNFEVFCKSRFGAVLFRLKGKSDKEVVEFVERVNKDGKLYIAYDKVNSLEKNNHFCKLVINDLYINDQRVDEIAGILNRVYNSI